MVFNEQIYVDILARSNVPEVVDKLTTSLGKLKRVVEDPIESFKSFERAAIKSAGNAEKNFMNLYFSVLGLQFSLMGLNRLIDSFASSVFSATLAATNNSGALAELKANNEAVWQTMLISIGTNENFINGLKRSKEALQGVIKWFADLVEHNERFAETLGEAVGYLPAFVGFLGAAAAIFMVMSSMKLVIGAATAMKMFAVNTGLASAATGSLFGWIFLLVIALIALKWAYKHNFLGFRDMIDKMRAFWFAFVQVFKENWKNALKEMFIIYLTDKIKTALGMIKLLAKAFDYIFDTNIAKSIQTMIDSFEKAKNVATLDFQAYYQAKLSEIRAEREKATTGAQTHSITINGLTFNVSSNESALDIIGRIVLPDKELAGDLG